MKTTNGRNSPFRKFTIILGLASIIGLNSSQGQETATPVQSGGVSEDVSSMSDFEVELQALEQTVPIPASQLPDAGTFWSAQHSPVSPEPWPPLPADILWLPVWPLGNGMFVLDDNHDPDYSAATNAAPAPEFNIQYDGMTVLLTAQTLISVNITNHVKIAVADYGDANWDSAVFITAGQIPCD